MFKPRSVLARVPKMSTRWLVALYKYVIEEKTMKEISAEMGVTVATVKRFTTKACDKLRFCRIKPPSAHGSRMIHDNPLLVIWLERHRDVVKVALHVFPTHVGVNRNAAYRG